MPRRLLTCALMAAGVAAAIGLAAAAETHAGAREASTSASGACTTATALQVMTRYHLVYKDPNLTKPILKPLCGAFAGPGSHAMAVTRVNGVCIPFNGWFVFVYTNGDWQRVPGGDHETT